jgi:hypothetical protein
MQIDKARAERAKLAKWGAAAGPEKPVEMLEWVFSEAFGIKKAKTKEIDEAVGKAQTTIIDLKNLQKELDALEKMAAAAAKKRKAGAKDKDEFAGLADPAAMMEQEKAAYQAWLNAKDRAFQQALTLENQYYSLSGQIAEQNYQRIMRLEQARQRAEEAARRAALAREQQEAKSRDEIFRNSIELFSELGDLIVQGEENRKAVRIAAIIATAAYEAAMMVAKGWEEISKGNPVTAAAAFTSAALYAAVAAGQVVTEASGGGAASADDRSSFQGSGESPWAEEKRETTIIVQLGGREAGRAVYEALEGYNDSRNPNRPRDRVT